MASRCVCEPKNRKQQNESELRQAKERQDGMKKLRKKCLIEEKSHKKQIICLKDEVYEDEGNLLVYLFLRKRLYESSGFLNRKGIQQAHKRNVLLDVVRLSTSS